MPLKIVPIALEFELRDTNDAIVTPQTYNVAAGFNTIYTTTNCCIKCDICTLDNAINNSYVEHLLAGKALPIEYSTYISQQSSVVGKSFAVQVERAVSRLQRAFITFYNYNASDLAYPFKKPTITFHHPMSESTATYKYNPNKEIQLYLQ